MQDAVFFDFQAFLGVDGPFHFAGNAHDPGLDIPFHFSLVVDHHGAVGNDLTLKVGVQPDEPARDLHLAFHLHTRLEPADPITRQVGEFATMLWVCPCQMPFRPPKSSG